MRTSIGSIVTAIFLFLFPTVAVAGEKPDAVCDVIIATGAKIQTVLDAQPVGATICLATAGSYTITSPLDPKVDQEIRGATADPRPVITCNAPYCFDGKVDGVILRDLIVQNATDSNIITDDDWLLDNVQSRFAGLIGIKLEGQGVIITDSRTHTNGQFGIKALQAVDPQVIRTIIDHNNTKGFSSNVGSGGTKFIGTDGLVLQDNHAYENKGPGLWLDLGNEDFLVAGNLSENNIATYGQSEGIRIEISCHGTVEANTLRGNQEWAELGLQNSNNIIVRNNDIDATEASDGGIRVIGNGRKGTGTCSIDGEYRNVDNLVEGNAITMPSGTTYNGVIWNTGTSARNSFVDNEYWMPNCTAKRWRWWTGTTLVSVAFGGWQNTYKQDVTGECYD